MNIKDDDRISAVALVVESGEEPPTNGDSPQQDELSG
jgi:hypothetical protein